MIKKSFLYKAVAGSMMLSALLLTGCGTPQKIAYFQDVETEVIGEYTSRTQIKIVPEDKLTIIVKSKDPALSDLFNLTIATSRVGSSTSGTGARVVNYVDNTEGITSYTVDPAGNIDFPVLGSLHVAGMTRSELAAFIKGEIIGRELIKDPVVSVEFVNTGISVLGEVLTPGRYDINRDNINVLQALALAGDLTINGQRENVLVIREEDGQMKTYRLDLTNLKELTKSPAFNLRQDDVVYVEPNSMRKRSTTVNGNNVLNASFWVSVTSLLTSVAVLIVNSTK